MERMPEGLLLWKDMLCRHEYAVIIWTMKGDDGYPGLEYVSENICQYGYTAEEYLEGQVSWMDLICDEDKCRIHQEGGQLLLRAGGNLHQEYRVGTRGGGLVWVEAHSCYIRGDHETSDRVETVIRDITKCKERERALLENQRLMQAEVFDYMESTSEKTFEENLLDFIKEQKIEMLQAAFTEIYGIHAALIGRDYYFYTHMTGPKEEMGIFYDLAELRSFHRKVNTLEEILDSGQRNVILSMQSPCIRISGVPIFYEDSYVATWVLCCLEEKQTEDILRILEFMRIMAETISEYYTHHRGTLSIKGYAFEHYKLKKKVELQAELLELYDQIENKSCQEKLKLLLTRAGELTNSGRCALFEAVPNSIYARCVSSWLAEDEGWNIAERETYSVQAVPNPETLLEEQNAVVLDSVRIPREWRDTMSDLYASAAVLIAVEWNGKTGFLSFQEIGQERVWEEEYVWFFGEIKKIIEKALLKSE